MENERERDRERGEKEGGRHGIKIGRGSKWEGGSGKKMRVRDRKMKQGEEIKIRDQEAGETDKHSSREIHRKEQKETSTHTTEKHKK